MAKRKPKTYNPAHLIEEIEKWPNPMLDKRHGYSLYVYNERARSNQNRVEHIIKYSHDLKARDLELVPDGIINYFVYKKDPTYKDTYNYYIIRKGKDRGFVKISIQIDNEDRKKAWIKTIFITYRIK